MTDVYSQVEAHWRESVGCVSHFWPKEAREKWGKENLDAFESLAGHKPSGHVVEWGPGAGCILEAFQPYASQFTGIDIAQHCLDACEKAATVPFVGILADVRSPESVQCDPADVFLCLAVTHHMPSEDYVMRVLAKSHEILKQGGLALWTTMFRERSEIADYDFGTRSRFDAGVFGDAAKAAGWQVVGSSTKLRPPYEHTLLRK